MAIPSNPSVSSIVTEGLKRGGRPNPTATEITNTTEHQFREVKADITQRSSRHPLLETQYVTAATHGQTRYAWPTDADDIRSLVLVISSTDGKWQGTSQTASGNSVTLEATFDQDEESVRGKFIFILGGVGPNQFNQIVGYNNSTKVASVERTWTTNPTTSLYHIGLTHRKLYIFDKPWGFDSLQAPFSRGSAFRAAPVGREMWLDYTPDAFYALWWDYWANLDQIDEAGTVFVRHLREYRSLWIQGIAVKTMQRYDEDRYQLELQVYENMLNAYAGYSAGIGQVNYTDV